MLRKDKFPPDLPPAPTKPLPQGSIVTGYTHSGIFGFPQHRGHGLFELLTKPHKTELNISNSGYIQDVLCITCGDKVPIVDCEFLMTRATKEEVIQVMHEVTKARNRLLAARKHYNQLIEEGKVK